QYARQRVANGTAGAVAAACRAVGARAVHVLVLNGDVPLARSETLQALMRAHVDSAAPVTVLVSGKGPVESPGYIFRDPHGKVEDIIHAQDLPEGLHLTPEINTGVYCFDAAWLWAHIGKVAPSKNGELYLTSLIGIAHSEGRPAATMHVADAVEALGVDTRARLAEAEAAMRDRIRRRWLEAGVTLTDPASTYIDADARIGQDTVIRPNTHILGTTRIGENCDIGPGTLLSNAQIGDRCRVLATVIEDSTLESDVRVGPYSHLRGQTHIERGVDLGNFVEIKKSRLGVGTRSHHFSYLGDATIGKDVNIGAGTITCNYDGVNKMPTIIADGAFIGCDTMLVAPVKVGRKAKTGAGAVVNRDVAPNTLVVGVPARPIVKAAAKPARAVRASKRVAKRRKAKAKE
ncbi:MAG: bifunctional UDP-N-acetylglucosamine diphosphorylase/glucosamine-1-phosphate N-acetyltransferase GlmU, partial [Chloroflexi bacterium]|nr:bifunctional UDP-N-acetylglucosamine diphosphorylase/glucosamine-1-phosphate N-acetyltransferase GlmU [Chloroflexota bacterium]